MNKKKLMRSGIALALSISMAGGITFSTPAVAEAGTGNIIGANAGGVGARPGEGKGEEDQQTDGGGGAQPEKKVTGKTGGGGRA